MTEKEAQIIGAKYEAYNRLQEELRNAQHLETLLDANHTDYIEIGNTIGEYPVRISRDSTMWNCAVRFIASLIQENDARIKRIKKDIEEL